ncbi:MAG: hypothetical protein M3N51_00605 [Actinomycetota bacterium]|nr:hypothetical protein [Actinomycetota bacterium]
MLLGHRPAELLLDLAGENERLDPAIHALTAPKARERRPARLGSDAAARLAARPAWLHLDLDVLNEGVLPTVSYPQALGLDSTSSSPSPDRSSPRPTSSGVSVTDFNPDHDPDETTPRTSSKGSRGSSRDGTNGRGGSFGIVFLGQLGDAAFACLRQSLDPSEHPLDDKDVTATTKNESPVDDAAHAGKISIRFGSNLTPARGNWVDAKGEPIAREAMCALQDQLVWGSGRRDAEPGERRRARLRRGDIFGPTRITTEKGSDLLGSTSAKRADRDAPCDRPDLVD